MQDLQLSIRQIVITRCSNRTAFYKHHQKSGAYSSRFARKEMEAIKKGHL
jgi:hypothetical protein